MSLSYGKQLTVAHAGHYTRWVSRFRKKESAKMTPRLRLPAQHYLLECFSYSPDTGEVRWKHRPSKHFKNPNVEKSLNGRYAGKKTGSIVTLPTGQVYVVVGLDGAIYRLSRIILKMVNDTEAENVDHWDCDPLNNRFSNLRPCTHAENMWNRKVFKNNKTGLKGVSFCSARQGYVASIKVNGDQIIEGPFDSAEEAHNRYEELAADLHKNFARFQ